MTAGPRLRLRPDVVFEPLIHQWYAWSYLIPPATAARYLTHAQLPVMESFVDAPQVHVDALRDPAMVGGPFVQHPVDRADEVAALLEATRTSCRHLVALSDAITRVDEMLDAHPPGESLEVLYPRLPEALRGYVELVYDARDCPSVRYMEPLLYHSDYYRTDGQSVGLRRLPDVDRRAFVMSTPRLTRDFACHLPLAFADPRLDTLAALRDAPGPVMELAESLALRGDARAAFVDLFTETPRRPATTYDGDDVRVRYLGHACVLVETRATTVLIDPLLGYESTEGLARQSYADLPGKIDYALITHNHQDHVMFETLLQLRHKIGTVVVARGQKGSLLDPSLKLTLEQIGFRRVRELDELQSLSIDGGRIVGVPVLGEHGDLNIGTKTAYWVELEGRSVLCAADSNNLDSRLYEHLHQLLGSPDILFLGMECDGAPYNWSYGPLLPASIAHRQAQTRRLDGSNADRALRLVETLSPSQVYVYAMGQEPWLGFITSLHYTDDSAPIVESNKLVHACRDRGIRSERLLGCRDFVLAARASEARSGPAPRLAIPSRVLDGAENGATDPNRGAPAPGQRSATPGTHLAHLATDGAALRDLLARLGQLDVRLWLEGDRLRVSAPKGALTSALKGQLKEHKAGIIALLGGRRGAPGADQPGPTGESAPWQADLGLDPSLRPTSGRAPRPLRPREVLLTGATGFLGAYLLAELLERTEARIHCLVRATSGAQAEQRLREAVDRYGLDTPDLSRRVVPVCGDLEQATLGLAEAVFDTLATTVDAVYHNGARVHHGMPYPTLAGANVSGTRELIRLACAGNVPLHYVSTLSVLPATATAERRRFVETDPIAGYPAPRGGYNLTKWVAEHLVAAAGDRGLPVTVYRPGPISGDSRSGAFNENDFLYRLMAGYVQSGLAPDGATMLDLLPVDFIARAVVGLSLRPEAAGETYHLLHPEPVSSEVLFEVCREAGYAIERVPYDTWFRHLGEIASGDQGHALFPLVALFSSRRGRRDGAGGTGRTGEASRAELPFDTRRTRSALRAAGLTLPTLDEDLFRRYLAAMRPAIGDPHSDAATTAAELPNAGQAS